MKNSKAQTLSHVSLFTSIDNPSSIFDLYGLYDDILREKIDKVKTSASKAIEILEREKNKKIEQITSEYNKKINDLKKKIKK